MTKITDEQLIGKYLKGDEKSLEVLIKKYLKPIHSFVYKNIGNSEVAQDLTQEVFVKVWKNLKKFDRKKQFKSWVFTIAKNTSIDFLRQKKKETLSLNEDLLFDKSDFIKSLEQKDALSEVHTALQKLSPNYRAIVLLKNEGELTFNEIAQKLNKPLNTIKSRYRRALIFLRNNASRNF